MSARSIIYFLLITVSFFLLPSPIFAQTDITPPVTDYALNPTTPDGNNSWYKQSVSVTLDATDLESGVKDINWSLNGGPLNTESFSNTLNIAPNPSFENSGAPIEDWEKGATSATYFQDPSVFKFDSSSAKISASISDWHAFKNENTFVPATYLDNMSASIWVKGESAVNAKFEVYALYDDGGGTQSVKIAESDILSGTFDWVLLPLAFTVNVQGTFGIYVEFGIGGTGTVWFDGISINSSVNPTTTIFSVGTQGDNTIEFYSVDNAGNEELPHNSFNFKIDSIPPSNFKNFSKTEMGNDHTFTISIDVDDTTSGLDVSTAQAQYLISDDAGTWGYFSDFLSCSSSWNQGSWFDVPVTPNVDGSKTVTFTTPAIDFCNSNWESLKKIKFRISDLSGSVGTSPEIVINGPWVNVIGGDVYGEFGISMGSTSQTEYLLQSGLSIDNFNSGANWYSSFNTVNYQKEDYEWWKLNFPPSGSLPGGMLPSGSGRYEVEGDLTLDGNTLNDFDKVDNAVLVVFVDGNLTIDKNYTLKNTSALFFIVSGNVTIDGSRDKVEGFFILDGTFDSGNAGGGEEEGGEEGHGNEGKDLTITGGVIADTFNLQRSLSGNKNETNPSEIFNFDPKYLVLGPQQLGFLGSLTWREVAYRTPQSPLGSTCGELGGVCCDAQQTGIGQEYSGATDCLGSCFDSCDNKPSAGVSVWLKWNNFVIFSMSASDTEDPDYLLNCIFDYGDGSSEDLDCRFGFWVHIFSCPPNQECSYTSTWTVTDTVGGSTPASTGVLIENYSWRF